MQGSLGFAPTELSAQVLECTFCPFACITPSTWSTFFSLIALTLLTPRESSLLQRELLELPAQVRPRIALFFYCITSHYLFSQMFRSLGTETVATLFPGIISVANTLHSAWHI